MSSENIPRARVRMICRISRSRCSSPPAFSPSRPLHPSIRTSALTTKRSEPESQKAQQYFDQGLRLVYGFNHAEAIRSFTRATELGQTRPARCAGGESPTRTGPM